MSATCRRFSAACTTKEEEEDEEGREDEKEEREGRRERERGRMVLASKRKLAFALEEEEGREDEEEVGRPGLNSWSTAAKPEMDQLSICSTTLPPLWGS